MAVLIREELETLIGPQDGPCISIYQPTHRRGKEIDQDPIRFKNLLRDASDTLEQHGHRGGDISRWLEPARRRLDDGGFWRHQSDGLAVFITPDSYREYRLPLNFPERAVVANRFYVKPLVPLITGDGHYYVLVFSQKELRLLHGSRLALGEIDLGGVPTSLTQLLASEEYQKQLQFHTGTPGRGGQRDAVRFGAGDSEADRKQIILKYFRRIDGALVDLLREEAAPLVLAGVEYLFPLFREATRYPHVLETTIPGNHDDTSTEELHRLAWERVSPHFRAVELESWERFQELTGTGSNLATKEFDEVIRAAMTGRIDTLLVARGEQRWGRYDPTTDSVTVVDEQTAESTDLLDLAVVNTLTKRGKVYVMGAERFTPDAPARAILRY